MQWRDVEGQLSKALGVPVLVRVASRPAPVEELSAGERVQMPAGGRRHDWLLGRAALKLLLDGGDTSGIRFPDRCFSISHAAGLGVAASCAGAQPGLGVDYEGWRPIDPGTARLFLHDHERATGDLLRLWTVKEALYKATPDNLQVTFLDYALAEAGVTTGVAVDRSGRDFRYASVAVPSGWVTVAVCQGRG